MAITETQRQERSKFLGSSDVAAVMGLDPFTTAYDVWAKKTGKVEGERPDDEVLSRGRYMENALLSFATDQLGGLTTNPEMLEFHYADFIIDHPDAVVFESGQPVEAKSVGRFSKEEWGNPGSDEIPERVIVQCHVHLLCTEKDFCHVPVYLSYREFQMFGVKLDSELAQMILDKAGEFWAKNVQKDIPPPDSAPSYEIVRHLIRIPASVAQIPDSVVYEWEAAKATRLSADKIEEAAKMNLLAAIGTAEAGQYTSGLVTYYESDRKGYVVEASKVRTLRIKKN